MQQSTNIDLDQLLEQAAHAGAEQGVDLESFLQAAWNAYVDAIPGYRAKLEHMQAVAQLELLRRAGRVGQA